MGIQRSSELRIESLFWIVIGELVLKFASLNPFHDISIAQPYLTCTFLDSSVLDINLEGIFHFVPMSSYLFTE